MEGRKRVIKTMTLKELSQLHHLDREIKMNNARFLSIDPKNCTADEATLRLAIETSLQRYVAEQMRLLNYIDAIPDSLTRTIFTLRFMAGLTARQTSEYMNNEYSADAIDHRVWRYLKNANACAGDGQNTPQVTCCL